LLDFGMSDMTSNILAYKPISSLAYKPNITLSITTLNCGVTPSNLTQGFFMVSFFWSAEA